MDAKISNKQEKKEKRKRDFFLKKKKKKKKKKKCAKKVELKAMESEVKRENRSKERQESN